MTGSTAHTIEFRKKRTFVKRDLMAPAEANMAGADPLPMASQPASINFNTELIEQKSELEVEVHLTPRKRRRYRTRYVKPDYSAIHHRHTSGRISLRLLHGAYTSGNIGSRTYGYAHFCAGYVRWLTNFPDAAVPT